MTEDERKARTKTKHDESSRRLGLAAVAAAAAFWAVAASVARGLFTSGVDPIELVEARAVIAAAGLALIPGVWKGSRGGRQALPLVLGIGVSIALVNATYYVAIDLLPVAVAIVLQYTAPVLVVLWVAGVERRRPGRVLLVALALSVSGVALVAELPKGNLGGVLGTGIAVGLTSAVLFSAYTLLSERAAAIFGATGALARAFAVAAVLWIAYQAPRGLPHTLLEADRIAAVLFVGIAGTLIPFLLFLWGVHKVAASSAAVAATLEPVLAAVVAWIWLGETLSLMQIGGGMLVLAGVGLLQLAAPPPSVVAGDPPAVAGVPGSVGHLDP